MTICKWIGIPTTTWSLSSPKIPHHAIIMIMTIAKRIPTIRRFPHFLTPPNNCNSTRTAICWRSHDLFPAFLHTITGPTVTHAMHSISLFGLSSLIPTRVLNIPCLLQHTTIELHQMALYILKWLHPLPSMAIMWSCRTGKLVDL